MNDVDLKPIEIDVFQTIFAIVKYQGFQIRIGIVGSLDELDFSMNRLDQGAQNYPPQNRQIQL